MTQLQGWSVAGKSWTALIGSALTFLIPTIVQMSTSWPEPWPAVIGAVVAVLTAVGVYHAPYRPVQQTNSGSPEQQVIDGINAVLEQKRAAEDAAQRVKDAVAQAVQQVPELGPLARQALDSLPE